MNKRLLYEENNELKGFIHRLEDDYENLKKDYNRVVKENKELKNSLDEISKILSPVVSTKTVLLESSCTNHAGVAE